MIQLLLDTYAWVEFFRGTEKGKIVKGLLEKETCFTCALSLAELSEWAHREGHDAGTLLGTVKELSIIIFPDEAIFALAGKINFLLKKKVKGWGLADSIILATAKVNGLRVVTGDKHFKGIRGTIFL